MKIIETLDDLGQLVYEIGCFYGDVAMDESLPEETRIRAANGAGKCAVFCARLNSVKNRIQQPDTSKFPIGGFVLHDFSGDGGLIVPHLDNHIDGGEYIIKKL